MKRQDFNREWFFGKNSDKKYPVTLPHDAMQSEKRDPKAPSGSGGAFYLGGIYEYEKTFIAPTEWENKHILLQFEGIYRNSKVYLNGREVGGAVYGYIPFKVCLDGLLSYGSENHIKVIADNSKLPNSRWYSGAGIYRPVWLWIGEKMSIEPESVKISTISYSPARIKIKAAGISEQVVVEILDGESVIASGKGNVIELDIPQAKLWCENSPYLYTCRVISRGDELIEKFGIRKVEWSTRGLYINGKETLLRGGCIHHDNGILGSATYDQSEWRRVHKLKEAGYNAIRSAHNPASRAMLEACDALGVYVMDETWDMWYTSKTNYDYASEFTDNYKADIKTMVERDFNHPSVILYSIGNEVTEPVEKKGVELAREMINQFHELDNSRPVTAGLNLSIMTMASLGNKDKKDKGNRAKSDNKDKTKEKEKSEDNKSSVMNSTVFNMMMSSLSSVMNKVPNLSFADKVTSPVIDLLDIGGYNYANGRYGLERKKHPDRVICGSETFPQDIAKNWAMVKKYPYLVGDFMWTAWDYLGETGIGAWAYTSDGNTFNKPYPWLLADVGAFDILGNPNVELYWAQAVWGCLTEPKIAVQPVNHIGDKLIKGVWRGTNAIPSWSWKNCEGNEAVIEVYYDCHSIKLLLNGSKIGKKKVKNCRAVFKTRYAAGLLEAVAYDASGKELGHSFLQSAKSADIYIKPEVSNAKASEVVYIPITIGDGNTVESNADRRLDVTIEGGELLAFGSANPRTEERFDAATYTTYYGYAMAIIRTQGNDLTIKVSDGKETKEAVILVNKEV